MTMRSQKLPAPFIIKNFVVGESHCDYQEYLLELLNCSKSFSEQYGSFEKPKSESNGECDAISSDYEIDFKLFASKTTLRASSLLESGVTKVTDGVITWGKSKSEGMNTQATRIFAAVRYKSFQELIDIRNSGVKKSGVENDIIEIMNTLETPKNLLLFFPYDFTFDTAHTYDEAVESIRDAISSDFKNVFKYRALKHKNLDCFFTCIYDRKFLIFKIENEELQYLEYINVEKLPSFNNLIEYTDWRYYESV